MGNLGLCPVGTHRGRPQKEPQPGQPRRGKGTFPRQLLPLVVRGCLRLSGPLHSQVRG